MVVPSL